MHGAGWPLSSATAAGIAARKFLGIPNVAVRVDCDDKPDRARWSHHDHRRLPAALQQAAATLIESSQRLGAL